MNRYPRITLSIVAAFSVCIASADAVLAATVLDPLSQVNTIFQEVILAYIDPGSAGFIVTTVLGFIAAVGYTIRLYFHRLKSIFSPGNRSSNETEEASARRDGEDGARS